MPRPWWGKRVEIGRARRAMELPALENVTLSASKNGRFISKGVSLHHAEVWEEEGRIFIKDVGSGNGAFINGVRLSPEGTESSPFELNTDDIVIFGANFQNFGSPPTLEIVARVQCVLNAEDVETTQRPDF